MKKSILYIILILFFLFSSWIGYLYIQTDVGSLYSEKKTAVPKHTVWTQCLQKYVTDEGLVNYKAWKYDTVKLNNYLETLSSQPPHSSWPESEQKAYWINAYNAFTIKLILDNYPLKSIKDLNPVMTIPFLNTVWEKRFFKIGGKEAHLHHIEHKVLRRKFKDPRTHFALNCASTSCPRLLNRAYEAENLDEQLDMQARYFINNEQENTLSEDTARISAIFNWYRSDFTKESTLREYINQYATEKIGFSTEIEFKDYDWSLNSIKKAGN